MTDSWQPEVDELHARRKLAEKMGGDAKIQRQHDAGRLTVRARISELADESTFEEIGQIAGFAEYDEDGNLSDFSPANFVMGIAELNGRRTVLAADDFTVRGGAADASIMAKQIEAERLANELRMPLVRLVEGTGGGGSVKMLETSGYTYLPANPGWDYVVDNLSVIPVVGACMGPVAGLGAARAVMAHFTLLVEGTAQLFVAGPPLVKPATGEDLTKEELGGAGVHRRSGAVDRIVRDEDEAFDVIKGFLSYLPQSVYDVPPVLEGTFAAAVDAEDLMTLVPHNRRKPYKLGPLLGAIFDAGSNFEYAGYGGSVYTGLARLDGHPVGVMATDSYKGATISDRGVDAMTRFVDLCETFHLPIVSLTDQAGLSIGLLGEQRGTIRHGVRASVAAYQARVPMAEIVVRRVFGVGGAGQINRHRPVRQWAWPSADWGSLPIEGGIEAAYRADIEASDNPEQLRVEIEKRLNAVRSPFRTVERFLVPDIIDPRESRKYLTTWVRDAYRLLPSLVGRPSFGTRP